MTQEIPIGDRPNHSYTVSKTPCTWTKPFEIAGQKAEGGNGVQVDERDGNTSRYRGHYLDRMSGGDTVNYSYEGVATFKGQVPEGATWRWTVAHATGKLRGLTGRGTCKGSWPEGTYRWSCSGRFRAPK